ncbi:MAG: cytochrome ubiquinol oxidase subunit I, partial [Actinomycetota bacterium]
ANSFMQHPVGVRFNPESGRAELESIWALLTNVTTLAAFPHVVTGALLTGGTFMAGVATWWMVRAARRGSPDTARVYRPAAVLGLWTIVVSGVGLAVTGDWQAKLMFEQQPMKMAAAEALCDTEAGAGFSIVAIGDVQNRCDVRQLTIPGLTAYLATGDPDATLEGVRDLQESYTERYGDNGSYVPILPVTYWSFRLMIGFGAFSALLALGGLWLTRRGRLPDRPWLSRLALWAIPMPFLANAFGWIFTEMGRQPWVVAPNPTGVDGVWLLTRDGVSGQDAWVVGLSLVAFTVIYGVLAVIWFGLMRRYAAHGAPEEGVPSEAGADETDRPLHFAY